MNTEWVIKNIFLKQLRVFDDDLVAITENENKNKRVLDTKKS